MKVKLMLLMETLDHQKKNLVLILLYQTQKFCLRLHYNVDYSYSFVNGKEIFKFKADNEDVNFLTHFFLGSISNGLWEVSLNGNPFMISLDKCTGSCNVLFSKIRVPEEMKHINVKTFNMVTNKNKAKTMTRHSSCDFKCKLNSTSCSSNQKWITKSI